MKIIPSDSTLGAVVYDIDIPSLDESKFATIENSFHEHKVLIFDQVSLTRDQHLDFSRRFGRLERTLSKRTDRSEISLISNVTPEGNVAQVHEPLGLFLKGNRSWHTDSSFKVVGAKASILRAIEVPGEGGDTEWVDMCSGWDVMDNSLKHQAEGLVGVHSYGYSQGLVGGVSILRKEELQALPPVEHPVVRVHPVTKRKSVYIGRHISHFVGMSEAESQDLMNRMLDEICKPPRLFRHSWRNGDLVIWDNRCVLHRGHPWDFEKPRVMERTTIAGDGENPWAIEDTETTESLTVN